MKLNAKGRCSARIKHAAIFLLLTAFLQARTETYFQTVSFKGKDVPLEQVFASIKKQSGYTFFFEADLLQTAHKVTLDVKNASIEHFLDICLKDEPLNYKIVGQTVFITKKDSQPAFQEPPPSSPDKEVKGRVTNVRGEPLAGATVTIKKLGKSGITDENGEFVLKKVPEGTYTVEISYVGYDPFTAQAEVPENTIRITAVLKPSTNNLDAMQVIAYGSTTQRLNTGDVTTISAADIERQPVNNPLLALEGRVPGLFITQSTGFAGSGVSVLVQGQNSIQSGNDPFYVIDGVPYTSQLLPNLGGILGFSGGNYANTGNPLNYIDPSEIESISVLKDAAATAIYGSRAANGAILITTKKGKAGKTKVDLDFQTGIGQVAHKLKLLNTPQYLEMRHEAIANDGLTTQPTDYDINGFWDTTRYTDWQKTLIGNTAQYLNLHATVSGGTASSQYLVGGTYHRETSVFPGDFADQKGSLHFNLNSVSANQKFRLQLSGNYLFDDNRLPNNDITQIAIVLAPDAPPLYKPDGSANWAPDSSGTSTFNPNPIASLYNKFRNKTNNLVSNMLLSYQVLPGLEIRSSFGYTNMQSNETATQPLISTPPELQPVTQRGAQYGTSNINSWIIEPQASYKKTMGEGKMDVLIGASIQQDNSSSQQLSGTGYNSDQVLEDIHSAASVSVLSNLASSYKYNALFSRLDYDWGGKYLIDLTARRDGSSRFGSANRFHDFGAAGIGWIFSQENFIKEPASWLSFGKLRASFGTTGNDQIGNYGFLDLYSPINAGVAYQGATGLLPNNLPNPYLQWEETRKWQVGTELGLLKDRVLVNATYFQNRSSNQLLNYALPIVTGFSDITKNLPATVQNTGWELTLNTINIKARDFSWTSHVNLTIPRNRLISFPGLSTSSYSYNYVIGQPITAQRVYHYMGVDPATGVYQFADSSGKPTPNPPYGLSNTVLVNTAPEWYGGFQNNFRYKGFELDFLFQYTRQRGQGYSFGYAPGSFLLNQPVQVLNRWQKPGDIASHQQFNSDYSLYTQYNDATYSDAAYSDASFLRLKNLSISWHFPEDWIKKARIQNARIYLQGQNLFTVTHYIGLDPETRNTNTLPTLRVITAGIQVGL